jgi:hypothetical protein
MRAQRVGKNSLASGNISGNFTIAPEMQDGVAGVTHCFHIRKLCVGQQIPAASEQGITGNWTVDLSSWLHLCSPSSYAVSGVLHDQQEGGETNTDQPFSRFNYFPDLDQASHWAIYTLGLPLAGWLSGDPSEPAVPEQGGSDVRALEDVRSRPTGSDRLL